MFVTHLSRLSTPFRSPKELVVAVLFDPVVGQPGSLNLQQLMPKLPCQHRLSRVVDRNRECRQWLTADRDRFQAPPPELLIVVRHMIQRTLYDVARFRMALHPLQPTDDVVGLQREVTDSSQAVRKRFVVTFATHNYVEQRVGFVDLAQCLRRRKILTLLKMLKHCTLI
uniref:(northern house mosquito) hypothetical protein n=1 Tax=Culex pipiens TaxID=7175 RepID=A0A8D8HS77_CULPI